MSEEPKRIYWLNIISSPIDGRIFYKNIKYCENRNSYYLRCKKNRFPEVLEDFITSISNKRIIKEVFVEKKYNPPQEIEIKFPNFKINQEKADRIALELATQNV